MKPMTLVMTALLAAAPALAAAQMAPATPDVRHDETPAERAARLGTDRAHSTAHADQTPAQRSATLAADEARALRAKRDAEGHAGETPAQRAARLATDRAHSTAHAGETPAQRAARLGSDDERGETAHHRPD